MHRLRFLTMLLAPAVLAACGGNGPRTPEPPEIAPALAVPGDSLVFLPAGIWIHDREVGSGEPVAPGQRVSVHYTGWLTGGARFDGSREDRPYSFTLGEGEVIPGWDHGIAGMRTGGRRLLVIPPALAYGDRGVGVLIPPRATLVFDVMLIASDGTAAGGEP